MANDGHIATDIADDAEPYDCLSGVRIVDLTMGWAGPTAARHLADLGAEIVKVEACQYPDWWRGTDLRQAYIAAQGYEKVRWFQLMNRNKLDVTLDLTDPEGAENPPFKSITLPQSSALQTPGA